MRPVVVPPVSICCVEAIKAPSLTKRSAVKTTTSTSTMHDAVMMAGNSGARLMSTGKGTGSSGDLGPTVVLKLKPPFTPKPPRKNPNSHRTLYCQVICQARVNTLPKSTATPAYAYFQAARSSRSITARRRIQLSSSISMITRVSPTIVI